MKTVYSLIISVVQSLAFFIAPFLPKVNKWKIGQKETWEKLKSYSLTHQNSKCIWFHAASLGEFEQGRPVIEAFRALHPEWKIVLTFFSPSGYEIRKDYDQADLVCYLPADSQSNVTQFLDLIQPDLVCFIKYEFWYNYLNTLKKRRIPTFLFSAIFRENQLFFKPYGSFYRKMLFCFDKIFVQNENSFVLLKSIGYQNVIVSGDTRLDRVNTISKQVKPIPEIAAFKNNEPLLVVGSAWPDDMEILIPFINQFKEPLKILIAPHEINQTQIEKWQKQIVPISEKWTNINTKSTDNQSKTNFKVLFLDTIGLLSSVYQYADFAYIGGAFGDGLHNILEPAAFGMPIFFGDKKYSKFQEAFDLIAQKAAFTISNETELYQKFNELYQNKSEYAATAIISKNYIQKNAGATQIVIDVLNKSIASKN